MNRGENTMQAFVGFMASTAGRVARIVAGVVLIVLGLVGNAPVVAVIGIVPILAGVLDFCLLAPLFGQPFSGPKIRGGK